MLNNIFAVGDQVWTVFDPQDGFLKKPSEDEIVEISRNMNPPMYILNKHNYINLEPLHWSNDFYGNLIEARFLFKEYAPAADFLREYWMEKYALVVNESARLRTILRSLDT